MPVPRSLLQRSLWFFAGLLPTLALAADLELRVGALDQARPISPWLYGINSVHPEALPRDIGFTWCRLGGNRLTAYNWENNASNAGTDYKNQNDDFAGAGPAGEFVRNHATAVRRRGMAEQLTLQLGDWVARDKNGPVSSTESLSARFVPNHLWKDTSPCHYPPDLGDNAVYQEEFLRWFVGRFPHPGTSRADTLLLGLDNEPDLWSNTHPLIFPRKATYADTLRRNIEGARLARAILPQARILGPASYGWNGYESLQDAPDADGRNWIETYLNAMRDASEKAGTRLLDALSLHIYSEATGGGTRVVFEEAKPEHLSEACIEARLQAPRSLWDEHYLETSWITRKTQQPLRLIPAMRERIARCYPGTALCFEEYNYGGGDHISGALALLDILGIFAREGVDYACFWPEGPDAWHYLAFRLLLNPEGNGLEVGETLLPLETNNSADFSAYAYGRCKDGGLAILVLNKKKQTASLHLSGLPAGLDKTVRVLRLAGERPVIQNENAATLESHDLTASLPGWSASLFILRQTAVK